MTDSVHMGGIPSRPPPTADELATAAAIAAGTSATLWGFWIGRKTPAPTVIQRLMVMSFAVGIMGIPAFLLTRLGVQAVAAPLMANRAAESNAGSHWTPPSSDPNYERIERWTRNASHAAQSAWSSALTGFERFVQSL